MRSLDTPRRGSRPVKTAKAVRSVKHTRGPTSVTPVRCLQSGCCACRRQRLTLPSTYGYFSRCSRYSACVIRPAAFTRGTCTGNMPLATSFLCRAYSYAVQATYGPRAKGRAVSATEVARWRTRSEELRRQPSGRDRQAPAPRRCASAAPALLQCWRASVRGALRARCRGRRGRQGAPAPLLASPAWQSCPRTCRRHASHRQQHSTACSESRSL